MWRDTRRIRGCRRRNGVTTLVPFKHVIQPIPIRPHYPPFCARRLEYLAVRITPPIIPYARHTQQLSARVGQDCVAVATSVPYLGVTVVDGIAFLPRFVPSARNTAPSARWIKLRARTSIGKIVCIRTCSVKESDECLPLGFASDMNVNCHVHCLLAAYACTAFANALPAQDPDMVIQIHARTSPAIVFVMS